MYIPASSSAEPPTKPLLSTAALTPLAIIVGVIGLAFWATGKK